MRIKEVVGDQLDDEIGVIARLGESVMNVGWHPPSDPYVKQLLKDAETALMLLCRIRDALEKS
jgi:hypothetical protein